MIHSLFIVAVATLIFTLLFGMPIVDPYTGTIVDVINTIFTGVEILDTAIDVPLLLFYFSLMFIAETAFYVLAMYLAGVKILRG